MAGELEVIKPGASTGVAEYNPQQAIMQLAQSKAIIQHVMKAIMKGPSAKAPLGIHYGVIPGTPKPTLYKAGSEIILSTFRISVEPIVEDLSTEDCIRYRVKAIGRLPDGTIVGYGTGECSTDEEKYRWKKPACDTEFNETPPTRRRLKWGRGSNGKADYSIQQIRTNPADLANTVLKMAKKRAQIDLTLTATGASDVFDQDLEDLQGYTDMTGDRPATGNNGGGKPEVSEPGATGDQGGGQSQGEKRTYAAGDKVKPGGAKLVRDILAEHKVTEKEFCTFMNISSVDDLLSGDMNRGINAIKKGEIPALGGA